MKKTLGLLLLCIVVSSCGTRKKANRKKEVRVEVTIPPRETPKTSPVVITPTYNSTTEYIAFFKGVAIHEMKLYGIPASITLAQGILESGSGRGRLARDANNHFGIKCHDWTGPRVYHDDDRAQECFRKYNDPNQSYRDHSLFLAKRKRYANLFKHKATDYKAWARGLKKAGYATDPKTLKNSLVLSNVMNCTNTIFLTPKKVLKSSNLTAKNIQFKKETRYILFPNDMGLV